MPKIGRMKRKYTKKEREQLDELEILYEEIINELLQTPSNEMLYAKLRETGIRIVRITKEKIIDY